MKIKQVLILKTFLTILTTYICTIPYSDPDPHSPRHGSASLILKKDATLQGFVRKIYESKQVPVPSTQYFNQFQYLPVLLDLKGQDLREFIVFFFNNTST